jgi:hypothetical protein|tara:strand:- start:1888 stop:2298 length:411 start_codon:yes stop_codon:yes gene_type:complete
MKVYSLIDITETKQRRNNSDNVVAIGQQANWMTFVQTMMLRTNMMYESPTAVKYTAAELKKLGFGTDYKGGHTVWEVDITTDSYQTMPAVESLESDFNLVPTVANLTETIRINNNVFRTSDQAKNILFKATENPLG